MKSWIWLAAISAVLFGVGDFFVVQTEKSADVLGVFAAYSVLIGVAGVVLLATRPKLLAQLRKNVGFSTIALIAALHFVAYLMHFIAIQGASNPGYANALVMFHVAVLAVLSWWLLKKPLNAKGVAGIALMFVGASVIVRYS